MFQLALRCIAATFLIAAAPLAWAQLPLQAGMLLPRAPTSLDTVRLSLVISCGQQFTGNPYTTSMAGNRITVRLGPSNFVPTFLCPPGPRFDIDLGRFPAGEYVVEVVQQDGQGVYLATPFTVTEGRVAGVKRAPYVLRDFSGQWWNPARAGEGIFLWQSARDYLMLAWYTYSSTGEPVWYVSDGGVWTSPVKYEGTLLRVSRPGGPGTNFVPVAVGQVSVDFTTADGAESAVFTYTFTGQSAVAMTIVRFNP